MKHLKFTLVVCTTLFIFLSCNDDEHDDINIEYTNQDFMESTFKYEILAQKECDSLHDAGVNFNCYRKISFINSIDAEFMNTDIPMWGNYSTQGDSIIFFRDDA